MTDDSSRWLGPTLVLGSAVLFSLSGVLTKAIDAESWTILTWRGLIGGIGIGAYVWWRSGRDVRSVFHLDRYGWGIAAVGALGSITFIGAFKNTLVANVSVIYATIPFAAAGLERLILGEPFRRRTLRAATITLMGVVVIVGGSLGTPNVGGDALAVAMVVLNALYMVLIRAFPDTDSVLAAAAGGPLLFITGWFVVEPLDVAFRDMSLMVLFGLVFGAATVLWVEGTRLIPASESGLLGSVETPLAIGLAWVVLSEAPPWTSLAGAVVVLAAVIGHTRADLIADSQPGLPGGDDGGHA